MTEILTAAFAVDIRQGCYVPCTPLDKFVKVTVTVPDLQPVELLIPMDMPHTSITEVGRPWSEITREAIRLRNAYSGTERADITALTQWLDDPANVNEFDQAWAARRLRKLQQNLKRAHVLLGEHCRRWGLEDFSDVAG